MAWYVQLMCQHELIVRARINPAIYPGKLRCPICQTVQMVVYGQSEQEGKVEIGPQGKEAEHGAE